MLPSSSVRIGMNAVGLLACGSSDLKLPSQRSRTSGLTASLLTAYSGGAAPESHRLPIHRVSGVIRQFQKSRKAYPRAESVRMGILQQRPGGPRFLPTVGCHRSLKSVAQTPAGVRSGPSHRTPSSRTPAGIADARSLHPPAPSTPCTAPSRRR
jgi:hypothetical protein